MRRLVSSGSPLEPEISYSRAVRVGSHVAVSASTAIWPDGEVRPNPGEQARRSLAIIGQALTEAGTSLADVVRTRVFLVDAADIGVVRQAHAAAFADVRPATGFVVVSGFLGPRWKVEIEADAIIERPSG